MQGLANTPDWNWLANLALGLDDTRTCSGIVGRPLTVTSGYRSPEVNAAIPEGGAHHSAHEAGRAGDIVPKGMSSLVAAFDALRASEIPFDQCILESACVHLACAAEGGHTPAAKR